MSRLYDRSFKIGFIFTIGVFALLNVGSYLSARSKYLVTKKELEFNPIFGITPFPSWGFPFSWFDERKLLLEETILDLALNVFVILGCAFVIGLLTQFFRLKQRSDS